MQAMTLDKLPRKVLERIDLQTAFMASRCVVAAEQFQLFRKLHGKELTASDICRRTEIKRERIVPFLAALIGLGLLKKTGRKYTNTALANKYYVRERSINWTRAYSDECKKEYSAFSVLEEMLTTGKNYESLLGIKRTYYVELMEDDPQFAHDFTHMLYHEHLKLAKDMASKLDMKGRNAVLDVGGGSGVMSEALVRKNRKLRACVMDIEPVIGVARKIIRKAGLSKRIDTLVGDMSKSIPEGYDVIMHCDAGGSSETALKLSYQALPPGGMIVLCEPFSTEDLVDPFGRLMWQIRSERQWLVTKRQAIENLRVCGFKSVKQRKLCEGFWMVTALKQ